MADFSSDLSGFRSSFPFLGIDPNMESISHQTLLPDSSELINFHTSMPFYSDSFSNYRTTQLAEFPGIFLENFPPNFHQNNQNIVPLSFHHHLLSVPGVESESKKRKAIDVSECSSMNPSPQVSDNGKGKNISRRGKKAKGKEQEEAKEVVHVRARRGQATDSHSLAERVRRGKINERLRCLQDIVPGCYKKMGMAVMLDEIINYVQSLQNQVEFLSMKLTAASTFFDFNSETDVIETMQIIKAEEEKENARVTKQACEVVNTDNYNSKWSL